MKVVAVGQRSTGWLADGVEHYQKRLRNPFTLEWVILPNSHDSGPSGAEDEARRILNRLKHDDYVILLDETGEMLTSNQFSEQLASVQAMNKQVAFIIGGSYGVDPSLFDRADFTMSLSGMVFPHQLVRLILVEQIYRAQTIRANHPYHHA